MHTSVGAFSSCSGAVKCRGRVSHRHDGVAIQVLFVFSCRPNIEFIRRSKLHNASSAKERLPRGDSPVSAGVAVSGLNGQGRWCSVSEGPGGFFVRSGERVRRGELEADTG